MIRTFCLLILTLSLCAAAFGADSAAQPVRLPTGKFIQPAGHSIDIGNMPLSVVLSPEKDRLVLMLNGYLEQGIQVVDPKTGAVVQTLEQPAAFYGLVFSSTGTTLYASGGNEDAIYRYQWKAGRATKTGVFILAPKKKDEDSTRFPAGLALSKNNRYLYAAENLSNTLAVVDTLSGKVVQRFATGPTPFAVVRSADGSVYVSSWAGNTITRYLTDPSGRLKSQQQLAVGRNPSSLLLNKSGSRLYATSGSIDRIAVIDTHAFQVVATLQDRAPAGPAEGSTPDGLTLSADETRLFVMEADNNAVAVFDLSAATSDMAAATGSDLLTGRIPVGWYPTAALTHGGSLYVVNGKGNGTRANPGAAQMKAYEATPQEYTLGILKGTLTVLPERFDAPSLEAHTKQVSELNGWNQPRAAFQYPPLKHVIYVIKENRTYDQVLGDLKSGDGDESLVFFPRKISPNHHALAERFGLFDRFFVNAEVSMQGHPWTTSGYSNDYLEKTVTSAYSDRRPGIDNDEAEDPAEGYLWDLVSRKGLWLRNYGEYVSLLEDNKTLMCSKESLVPFTHPTYPGFNMEILDQHRVDIWIDEFKTFENQGDMPALQILYLPSDHTAGTKAGARSPQACMADNDLALGRVIETLSKSKFWKDTVLFAVEDDSQSGPDHVDSHRSVLLAVSAYNRGGVIHRFVNTTDVLATIEQILGIGYLSQFDFYGRPLGAEIFAAEPNLEPYQAATPDQSLSEVNPDNDLSKQSRLLKLDEPDASSDAVFNEILWKAIKGSAVPYPGNRHLSLLDLQRAK